MTSWRKLSIAAVGITALLASACSEDGGDADPTEESGGSAVAEEMRTWDACEVLDNLQPIFDYMQIEGVRGGDSLSSSPWGSGMDQQATTCNGLVTVNTFPLSDGATSSNEGELWVSIIPWDTEDGAKASYIERSVDDQEGLHEQSSTLEELDRIDLGSEWDEGVLIVTQDDQSNNLTAIARDGEWLLYVYIHYNIDDGVTYYNQNPELHEGKTEEDFAYPFSDEDLQQWVVDEYIPSVHQTITDRIG